MRACLATDPRCAWEDREARPYDTPICDFELPAAQARKLSGFEFGRVVSSPFRRCLQTAAVRRITSGLVLLAPGLALLCSWLWPLGACTAACLSRIRVSARLDVTTGCGGCARDRDGGGALRAGGGHGAGQAQRVARRPRGEFCVCRLTGGRSSSLGCVFSHQRPRVFSMSSPT